MAKSTSGRRPYEGTSVTISKSKEQVGDLLRKRGIVHTQWIEEPDPATSRPVHTLRFRIKSSAGDELRVRMTVKCPKPQARRGAPVKRSPLSELDAEERRIMRVFFHHLKTLFEATDVGLQRVEEVLLAHIEDAMGRTVGEHMAPHIAKLSMSNLKALGPAT